MNGIVFLNAIREGHVGNGIKIYHRESDVHFWISALLDPKMMWVYSHVMISVKDFFYIFLIESLIKSLPKVKDYPCV